ncbi:MAG: Arginase [uncultured Thermomicrobiales bacterium]|uniref:Arginase n=1 Tax=uncultured Thermomicrobiales bacterium TaxID=1645740 RepID=A0A6J4UHV3_9BACT|nr:MAG: Arginase [uncultured Thermomicrobiales bacterium]
MNAERGTRNAEFALEQPHSAGAPSTLIPRSAFPVPTSGNWLRGARIAPIAVPMGLGVCEFGPEIGPYALDAGLRDRTAATPSGWPGAGRLEPLTITDVPPSLPSPLYGDPRLKNREPILTACKRLARYTQAAIADGRLALALGGDHALSIGSIAGAAATCERLGILWIDTHADLNTPETTPSGNIHGMPMALALGHGNRALATIAGAAPKVRPEDVTMIGLRDLDAGEEAFLARHPVRVYRMAQIDALGGFAATVARAIDELAASGVDAVHLSFDLDVLDPSCFTATSTPVPGGLIVREALAGLRLLRESTLPIRSVDWVELNPLLDTRGASTGVAVRLLKGLLGDD